MAQFTEKELRKRAFERAAWVLRHFWEEQKEDFERGVKPSVHTRLFDTLIHHSLIYHGESEAGTGHKEHLVPCVLLRDQAFSMYHQGKTTEEVAAMLERFLRVAHISPEEAKRLDHELKLKVTMPADWNFENGSVSRRLEEARIMLKRSVDSQVSPRESV